MFTSLIKLRFNKCDPLLPFIIMSSIAETIQEKCLAFGDRIIKLNDYLLAQAVAAHEEYKKSKIQKKEDKHLPSYISLLPSA